MLWRANATSPTNYVYFTVTPNSGTSVTYTSLLFQQCSLLGQIHITVIDGGGPEQVLDDFTITATGVLIHSESLTSPTLLIQCDGVATHLYNSGNRTFGIRLDDITLNGTTTAVLNPAPIAMGLLGVLSFAGNRRRRHQS